MDKYDVSNWKKSRKSIILTDKQKRFGNACTGRSTKFPDDGDRRWYCDKIPQDDSAFVAPTRYTKDDLVVGIFTGESIVYSRAAAAQDTWMAPLPHTAFYTAVTMPDFPTIGLERTGRKLVEDWHGDHNAQCEPPALLFQKSYGRSSLDSYLILLLLSPVTC